MEYSIAFIQFPRIFSRSGDILSFPYNIMPVGFAENCDRNYTISNFGVLNFYNALKFCEKPVFTS